MIKSKQNTLCHSELVSESICVSAWKVENNHNGSCQCANGFRTKSGMTGECGRSMVEMLGVLAIIGVLSVGGIAGYTTAMNKHRANEILNAASIRAMVVSTQIQNGSTSPTLAEFTDNKVGSATFGTDVKNTAGTGAWTKGTDNQFSLTLSGVDTKVCDQMKNIAGESSIIKAWGDNCTFLTYNNDLGSGTNISTVPNSCSDCRNEQICIGTTSSGIECVDKPDVCSSCGENQYCSFAVDDTSDCSAKPRGSCSTKSFENEDTITDGTTTMYIGPSNVNVWTAREYCAKFHTRLARLSDFGCSSESLAKMKTSAFSWGCCKDGVDCLTGGDFGPPSVDLSQTPGLWKAAVEKTRDVGFLLLDEVRNDHGCWSSKISSDGREQKGHVTDYPGYTALCID